MLEPRRLLSGVTLITHGFNGSVDDWIAAMADAIAARTGPPSAQPRYRVEVTDPGHDGGPLSVVNTSRSGPVPADWTGAADIVILLNWTDVAGSLSLGGGYHRSTADVAAAVAEKLVSPNFLTGLAAPAAELPFHLVGHSRGASLVGELAKKLGERGVWVDQVTTLDPHPVDGVREPWLFNYNFGDAPMTGWDNVTFWDNYWRSESTTALDFTGESVANVYNLQLSESVLTNGGYSYEHSDVHLWYHGTIDASPTAGDGSYPVPASWYGGVHPARNSTGYYYSRLVGGPRNSAGLSADLGGAANRTDINWSNASWPNLLELAVSGGNFQFMSGDPIPAAYYYQDHDSVATIYFSLDLDRNPYNPNALGAGNANAAQTGAVPVPNGGSFDTVGVPLGTYYVAARITDAGGHARYAYGRDPVTIVPRVPVTRTWDGGGGDDNWTTASNWVGDAAPWLGDYLVFPAGAARMENVNDFPTGTKFGSIVVSGGSYRIQDNPLYSATVAVQGNAALTASSIVGDALAIGAVPGTAANAIAAAVEQEASWKIAAAPPAAPAQFDLQPAHSLLKPSPSNERPIDAVYRKSTDSSAAAKKQPTVALSESRKILSPARRSPASGFGQSVAMAEEEFTWLVGKLFRNRDKLAEKAVDEILSRLAGVGSIT
ncbi:MAG: hypothetical protein IT426_04320 [Pirellulales bacterium]|nr:hypothetical protein [Pirellulales bacterium]